jgi:hypothetical protein
VTVSYEEKERDMSLVGDVHVIAKGTFFRNVNGSTDDPLPVGYSDWIGFWKHAMNLSHNATPLCSSTEDSHEGRTVGGHIVLGAGGAGAASDRAEYLKNPNRVFIVPLCSRCNGLAKLLQLEHATNVVQLIGFFLEGDIEKLRIGFEQEHNVFSHPYTGDAQKNGRLFAENVKLNVINICIPELIFLITVLQ